MKVASAKNAIEYGAAGQAPETSARAPDITYRPLLTLQDVAGLLRIHERTIRRLVAARRMPCVRLGRTLRFDPSDIERWVSARKEG